MRAKASLVIIGAVIGADQITKQAFPAVYAAPHVPVVVSATLILLLIYWLIKSNSNPLTQYGIALVVAGGMSNSIDQLAHDAVRDIAHIGTLHFNIADLCIVVGGVMIILRTLVYESREGTTSTPKRAPKIAIKRRK